MALIRHKKDYISLYTRTPRVTGCVSVLETAFVGQCEVFVCLDFVEIFFKLGSEAHRSTNGVSVL